MFLPHADALQTLHLAIPQADFKLQCIRIFLPSSLAHITKKTPTIFATNPFASIKIEPCTYTTGVLTSTPQHSEALYITSLKTIP
jgi:hypothetical protein